MLGTHWIIIWKNHNLVTCISPFNDCYSATVTVIQVTVRALPSWRAFFRLSFYGGYCWDLAVFAGVESVVTSRGGMLARSLIILVVTGQKRSVSGLLRKIFSASLKLFHRIIKFVIIWQVRMQLTRRFRSFCCPFYAFFFAFIRA